MKRKILLIALASIIVLSTCSLSTDAIQNNEKERGYISLSTSASTEVAPDVAEISFAVITHDTSSMQKATEINKEVSDKIYTILKGMINSANGDYIKTSDYSAQPIYTYTKENKRKLDKYEVSNRVIVHTKAISKIGTMIDKSIAAGATNVNSLNFSVSNYETQCNSLIEIATKKAKSRASIAATTMGTTLDGIKNMDISCSENTNYKQPRLYMAKNMIASTAEDSATGSSSAISEGVVKIYANVNATLYIK